MPDIADSADAAAGFTPLARRRLCHAASAIFDAAMFCRDFQRHEF